MGTFQARQSYLGATLRSEVLWSGARNVAVSWGFQPPTSVSSLA